jgi:hypothetical protein
MTAAFRVLNPLSRLRLSSLKLNLCKFQYRQLTYKRATKMSAPPSPSRKRGATDDGTISPPNVKRKQQSNTTRT